MVKSIDTLYQGFLGTRIVCSLPYGAWRLALLRAQLTQLVTYLATSPLMDVQKKSLWIALQVLAIQ
jgi:hypothetical protein